MIFPLPRQATAFRCVLTRGHLSSASLNWRHDLLRQSHFVSREFELCESGSAHR